MSENSKETTDLKVVQGNTDIVTIQLLNDININLQKVLKVLERANNG